MDGSIGWPQVYTRRPGEAHFDKLPRGFDKEMYASLGLSSADVQRRQRRHLGRAFTGTAIQEQEAIIGHYIDLLVRRIQSLFVDTGEKMDIVQWLNFTTFDIISDLTFGESFGSLESSAYHPLVLSIFEGVKADAFLRACNTYPLVSPLLKRVFGGKQFQRGKAYREWTRTKSEARVGLGMEPKGRRDFVTHMLRPDRDGPGLSRMEIAAFAPLLVIAGSETTASALSGFFFYLNQTSHVKAILVDEIRRAFSQESEISISSTHGLEYLQACLEEALRMYPPAPAPPPRISPGAEIENHFIPPGTSVHVYQWATFRNPQHFVDADSFCPERWLKHTHPLYDSRFAADSHGVFKPFSVGPRDCIGKNLAFAEMRLIAARLLFKFDVDVLPGQDDWHSVQKTYLLWDKGPLYLRWYPRGQKYKIP
ncbi:hypothetical protein JX265_003571 [Neoarthrinium moseri]|uniref:Isotrichodermin C-15 hydroxylase n=1 Tax=Neoarthrinium moseri TaxID=1658444 RepID=A0A9P9WSH1_9PEZI|nr:hypothetical protein JX265_003571 [Neoarthrinium moseri]